MFGESKMCGVCKATKNKDGVNCRTCPFYRCNHSENENQNSDNVNHPAHYTGGSIECIDAKKKESIWYSILQLLPESYNQRATVQLNYEVLLKIYRARKNHKLDEWRTFCSWIEMLPYMSEFLGGRIKWGNKIHAFASSAANKSLAVRKSKSSVATVRESGKTPNSYDAITNKNPQNVLQN